MKAEDRLLDAGYEGVTFFGDEYEDALVGVSEDGRTIYDYDLMVKWLVNNSEMDETEAIEWIDYNTIRALPYAGEGAPIVMFKV